jgi:hypothetical protein
MAPPPFVRNEWPFRIKLTANVGVWIWRNTKDPLIFPAIGSRKQPDQDQMKKKTNPGKRGKLDYEEFIQKSISGWRSKC